MDQFHHLSADIRRLPEDIHDDISPVDHDAHAGLQSAFDVRGDLRQDLLIVAVHFEESRFFAERLHDRGNEIRRFCQFFHLIFETADLPAVIFEDFCQFQNVGFQICVFDHELVFVNIRFPDRLFLRLTDLFQFIIRRCIVPGILSGIIPGRHFFRSFRRIMRRDFRGGVCINVCRSFHRSSRIVRDLSGKVCLNRFHTFGSVIRNDVFVFRCFSHKPAPV